MKIDAAPRLGQKTAAVMALTMLSRAAGFLRDVIFAHIFGAGAAFDAFVIAFKIPDLMRRLFGEGAFAQAFVPVLTEYKTGHSHAEIRVFINRITGVLSLIALALVVAGEIFAPALVILFAPGFARDPARYHLAVDLLRITQPYLFSIAFVALAGAILNTYFRFALAAFTPVVLNIGLIIIAFVWVPKAAPDLKIYLLAWGVFISGVIQLLIQWPALRRLNLLPKPEWNWRDSRVRAVFHRLIPALLGVSIAQISLLIDNLFASFLPSGSISWLYYSDRLIYFPLGVIGVALATVVLPYLALSHHTSSPRAFSAALDWGLRCVTVIAIPAAIGLGVLAGPIIATLMHHGVFTAKDVAMTRRSLIAFSIGLPAWMIIKMLATAFYSRQNIKTPAKIAGVAIFLNIALNFALIQPLAHAGLALATALASWFNAVLLWVFLLKKEIFQPQAGWPRIGYGILLASFLMLGFLCWQTENWQAWLRLSAAQSACRLVVLIAIATVVYTVGLLAVGLRWEHFKPPK